MAVIAAVIAASNAAPMAGMAIYKQNLGETNLKNCSRKLKLKIM